MGALIRFFGGNYQLYFVGALLLALGGVSSGYFYERGEAIEYRDKVAALNKDMLDARAALTQNAQAVTSLQAALDEWQGRAAAAAAAQASAVQALDAQAAQMQQSNAKLATTEKTDNGRPDCAKLLSMDLGQVCPGHVAAMRVRAANPTGL